MRCQFDVADDHIKSEILFKAVTGLLMGKWAPNLDLQLNNEGNVYSKKKQFIWFKQINI